MNDSVAGSQFAIGVAALDVGHRIIHDGAIGAVYCDSNGTDGTPRLSSRCLAPGLALTNHDFPVVG